MFIQKCKDKVTLIAEVAQRSRWPRIWEGAVEHGGRHTDGLNALTRPDVIPWQREEALPLL